MPPRMPEPRGKPVTIYAFIGVNHNRNVIANRPHTVIIICVHNAQISWYSKYHNTSEDATFGISFIPIRMFKEIIVDLCYKLRMFRVPADCPEVLYVEIEECSGT